MISKNWLRIVWSVFLIRLLFALLPSFAVDMTAWLAWAQRLAEVGPVGFYSDSVWTQYTPGFLYWLWFVGKLQWIDPLMIKIPVIVADMLTGYLIHKVISKSNRQLANYSFVLYVLNPVAIINGSIWGQIDGILTLLMMATTYLLVERGKSLQSGVLMGLSLLLKPQAVAILPIWIVTTLLRHGIKKLFVASAAVAVVVLAGYYPFFPENPLGGIYDLLQKMGVSYPYTSLFAYNVWTYVGLWIRDDIMWRGLSYFSWGTIMMALSYLAIIVYYLKHFTHDKQIYLMFALACFSFFLFPTRVHERYLYPMFAYLLTYAGSKESRALFVSLAIATITYSLNLYYPYSYYENITNPLKNLAVENWIDKAKSIIAAIQIVVFGSLWLSPARDQGK